MKVEIIILNYNGSGFLKRCLPSIITASEKSRHKPRVIVLDNNSIDDSQEVVSKQFPAVFFKKAKENRVLCSFNEVAKSSDSDIMILLNNDIVVDHNFVDPLVEIFKTQENVFLSAARVYNFDGTQLEEGRTNPVISRGVFKVISKFKGYEDYLEKITYTFQAGFGAFDRKKFLELGGYDDLYLPGILEDSDLCFRAWKMGYRCFYQPKSHIYHIGKASFKKRFGNKMLLAISHRNTYYFVWKNITNKKILFQNIFFAFPRMIYAIFTLKWEIVWGFSWFILGLPLVMKRRRLERANSSYCFKDVGIFGFFQKELPEERRIETLIGERFDFLSNTFPSSIDSTDSRLNAILSAMGPMRDKNILEVGCGKGRLSRIIKERGAHIYGIDISEKLLRDAAPIQPSHFLKAEAYNIPFKNKTFDGVVLLEVIEHLPELDKTIQELRRVIKKDGVLIIVDRNKLSLNNRRNLVPNLIIKRYHELKNDWMYPRDFCYRERWFLGWQVGRVLKKYFNKTEYSYVISDSEKRSKSSVIFNLLPITRHFILWKAREPKNILPVGVPDKFFNSESVEKEFEFRNKRFCERVAKYPKIAYQRYSTRHEDKQKNCDFLYPDGKSAMFSLRIDVDEVREDEFTKFLDIFAQYPEWITLFCPSKAFEGKEHLLLKAKDLGLDIQSHGHHHYTFDDYENNYYNLHEAKRFFDRLGIPTSGFAAPMGRYNKNLMLALEDLGYTFSSDFSFDYLNFPHFPRLGNRFSNILQVPIFPICPELLFENGLSIEEAAAYYDEVLAKLKESNLPIIIYAHTNQYCDKVRKLLEQLLRKVGKDQSIYKCNMKRFVEFWLGQISSGPPLGHEVLSMMPAIEDRITLDKSLFGVVKPVSFPGRMKNVLKAMVDFEDITPSQELKGNPIRKHAKLLMRKILKK